MKLTWRQEKLRERKRLAIPRFAKEEVPEEPQEKLDFFKDFETRSDAEKISKVHLFKAEQAQFLASIKGTKSKKDEARGKPERGSGSKRVPTPPPPPARPGKAPAGTSPKAPPLQKHWMLVNNLVI